MKFCDDLKKKTATTAITISQFMIYQFIYNIWLLSNPYALRYREGGPRGGSVTKVICNISLIVSPGGEVGKEGLVAVEG